MGGGQGLKFVGASATTLVRSPQLKALYTNSPSSRAGQRLPLARSRVLAPLLLTLLSFAAVLIHGYHPYAEDAGIYVAGIELRLHPLLFPFGQEFIAAHTSLSIFAPAVAALAVALHSPLRDVLFGLQIAGTWMLLFGCWQIARRCFSSAAGRWGAVVLAACCLTLPVAGTSLFMMDPYVTGRTFSTPCILLAISGCLDRRWAATLIPLGIAALFHPLMAIYATGFLLMLLAAQSHRWKLAATLCGAAVVSGAALQFSQRNVAETPAYIAAALTRSYFYISQWQWYEVIGIVAPPLMMFAYAYRNRRAPISPALGARIALCWAMVLCSAASIMVSLLFAHPTSHSHLVARLQPLRAFHIVYLVFFVLLGGLIGQHWLKRATWRWIALFGAVAATMFFAQRATYPSSPHLEAPWTRPTNPWAQAFLWIRANTPTSALFALDAHYITAPGEDAQGFRAEAERSTLADYSKDGGASAIFPQLAPAWMTQHTADTGLSAMSDSQRIAHLAPFGVTWIVLQRGAQTAFDCPYANAEIRVCRLPARTPQM